MMKKILVALIALVSFGTMAQSNIGFVNSQELLDTMPSRKAALEKYAAFEKEGYEELDLMEKELQKLYEEFQSKQGDWTPVIRQSKERKIMVKEQNYKKRQQTMQQELQAYGNELNAPILERVQDAVKVVAEKKKLDVVVDQTQTLYYTEKLDLTGEVAVVLLKLDKEAMAASGN